MEQKQPQRFFRSPVGHILIAFAAYLIIMASALFLLRSAMPEDGLHSLAGDVAVSLGQIPEDRGDIPPPPDPVETAVTPRVYPPVRLAVVLGEMGLSRSITQQAVRDLPDSISFSFSLYAENLRRQTEDARAAGHDVLLEIPLEPENFPDDDPGPAALLTRYSASRNTMLLETALNKTDGFSAVMPWMGSRFMNSPEHVDRMMRLLRARDIVFLDSSGLGGLYGDTASTATENAARRYGLPYLRAHLVLDETATHDAVTEQLERLAKRARDTDGTAVGLAQPYPATITALKDWSTTLSDKNITLVPVSEIIKDKQKK